MKVKIIKALTALALMLVCGCVCFVFVGCTTAHVKTNEWEATINSHWLKRDVDKLVVQRDSDGSYSMDLNGYRTDASEQFPAFTRAMWDGAVMLGRIAAAAYNPAASGVPLTTDAADGSNISKIIQAQADAQAQLLQAKTSQAAILEAAKADAQAQLLQAKAELAEIQQAAKTTSSSAPASSSVTSEPSSSTP